MTPDTYKPVLSVVVLPVDPKDQFKPGEYFSPRLQNSSARNNASILAILTSIFPMIKLICSSKP